MASPTDGVFIADELYATDRADSGDGIDLSFGCSGTCRISPSNMASTTAWIAFFLHRSDVTGCRDRPVWLPSPNFGERRGGARPSLVVIHYTAMDTAESALERLRSREYEVSAHYLIARDGRAFQLVAETKRAWHAGSGSWGGEGDVNSRSIGIELSNSGLEPFAAPQMFALEHLLRGIMADWSIRPEGVIGHSDFAIGRKADPGPRFDWKRLASQGLSVWPNSRSGPAADKRAFLAAAKVFGYPIPDESEFTIRFEDVLDAFRFRFRPWAVGEELSHADIEALSDLADRHPFSR